jgi:sigma-B regulation protein RsbU (phosphoserine phosphatase)
MSGVRWLLPVGEPAEHVLLLGRRLAGSWLDRHEARELERFGDHLETALENVALRREASTHVAFDRELREARAIQAHLLPRRVPAYPTLDCAAAALSSEPVGGDYYDFVETRDREFTLAVGDAAGKGVPAALLLAGVQARFRSEARRGLSPSALLGALNGQLLQHEQPEKFVGLVCAHVDVRRGRIGFANAGLTPPIVRRRDGRFEELTSSGVLLGVRPDAAYAEDWVDLSAGDVAVLYTDGLTEAQQGDEMFGLDRVQEVLAREGGRRAANILAALLSEVRAFADHPLDDLTVVVLRQLTGPVSARARAA